MKIKFNNIRDLADARYAAAMMAEWIGFEIGGENDLSASEIQEILGWCSGPVVVLEVKTGASDDKIQALIELLPFTVIEASGDMINYLKNRLGNSIEQWINNSSTEANADFWHTQKIVSTSNTICRVNPEKNSAQEINSIEPFAISLDCFDAQSKGMKDYEVWNCFFEDLGLV